MRVNFGERPFAYAAGHAHREAADVQEEDDSMEELAANFAILPFASSDSEGEAAGATEPGTATEGSSPAAAGGSVIELAQTGSSTKKLKTPIVTVGE